VSVSIRSWDLGPALLSAHQRKIDEAQERRGKSNTLTAWDILVQEVGKPNAMRIIQRVGGWMMPTERAVRVEEARRRFADAQMDLFGKAGALELDVDPRTLRRWRAEKKSRSGQRLGHVRVRRDGMAT
jgi:hypothetical protein